MKKILFISLIAVSLLVSCNKYLDIKPYGIVIPKTMEDYTKLINYGQLLKAGSVYPNYMSDDAYYPDDEGNFLFDVNLAESDKNLYTFQAEIFGDAETDNLWESTYNRIYYYNTIIKDVLTATDGTEAEKQSLRAEALMGRAFEYLTLVNAYGNHYDKATASTDLGVPLIKDPNINLENLTRATVQEVYDLIFADLAEAERHLPEESVKTAFRASKPVGLAMQARMYLYMGDYQKALDYANQSLAINSSLLDLKLYEVINPDRSLGRNNVPQNKLNPENSYIRLAPYVYGISGKVFGSDELMALFEDDDFRKKIYFTDFYGKVQYNRFVWCQWTYSNLALTTPEILLIAAECEARIGSKDKAMSLINDLRKNRIENVTPLTAANNTQALKLVLEERRRELAMLGMSRIVDLKRLNREDAFKKTIVHTIAGVDYKLEPNSPRYILPIPPKVLNFNPDMKPNVR